MSLGAKTEAAHGGGNPFDTVTPPARLRDTTLEEKLPLGLPPNHTAELWRDYQRTIDGMVIRMGREPRFSNTVVQFPQVMGRDDVVTRVAFLYRVAELAMQNPFNDGLTRKLFRLNGESALIEYGASAGFRTFCLPGLMGELLETERMEKYAVSRMLSTLEFLQTMLKCPFDDSRVEAQINKANELHGKWRKISLKTQEGRDEWKYIALAMFYTGLSIRPDMSPKEKRAFCGQAVLVTERMGFPIEGSVQEFDAFIADHEKTKLIPPAEVAAADPKMRELQAGTVRVARASKRGLMRDPSLSIDRIVSFVPYEMQRILEIRP